MILNQLLLLLVLLLLLLLLLLTSNFDVSLWLVFIESRRGRKKETGPG